MMSADNPRVVLVTKFADKAAWVSAKLAQVTGRTFAIERSCGGDIHTVYRMAASGANADRPLALALSDLYKEKGIEYHTKALAKGEQFPPDPDALAFKQSSEAFEKQFAEELAAIKARKAAEATDASPAAFVPRWTGTDCEKCGNPQYTHPGGVTCKENHDEALPKPVLAAATAAAPATANDVDDQGNPVHVEQTKAWPYVKVTPVSPQKNRAKAVLVAPKRR